MLGPDGRIAHEALPGKRRPCACPIALEERHAKSSFEQLNPSAERTEGIDTRTATGKLVFHLAGAFAEFERNIIRERTLAGLKAAGARGRKGRRPKKLNNKELEAARAIRRT